MTHHFATGEDVYRMPHAPTTAPAERVIRLHWTRRDRKPFIPQDISAKAVAHAEIDAGRWIVRCPWCSSAQSAFSTDPRFFCVDCLNEAVGHKWIRVVWPTNQTRNAIEHTLQVAPRAAQMRWRPDESMADVKRRLREQGG